MDLQEFIVVLLVIFLEGERQKIRLMNESLMADRVALQEKERERSMLMRNNQDMLAKEAAKEKLVDDFMAFIGANKNNENAHNFDEKAMMKAIETMMNSDGDDNGGFANGYGKRLKIRLMKESLRADEVALQEKERERSMLMRKNQDMLAKEETKKKLVDDFMAFIGANENNDNAQNFDEKAMMKAIETMMTGYGGDNGGFASGYGDSNDLGIDLGLEGKTTIDGSIALVNKVGSCDGDNGGFSGNQGEINNALENAQKLGKEATKTAADGTNGDGDEGSNAGGYGSSYNGKRRK